MTGNDWQAFLDAPVADSEPGLAAEGFCALSDYGWVRVSGPDAAAFLQGQTTCDVLGLAPGQSLPGALCTPKGRVVADFRLLRGDSACHLLLSADLAETVRKRLQTYVLRSRVVVDNPGPTHGVLGLIGDKPELEENLALPSEPGSWRETPEALLVRWDTRRWLLIAETGTALRIGTGLAETRRRLSPTAWRLGDIEAGLPRVVADTSEEFLPQMLNLDLLDGIGFRKGCYTGQEIVTRTHYLGQLKRRMFRLRAETRRVPVPGISIYDASGPEPRSVGQVVMAAAESASTCQLLAVISLEQARNDTLRLLGPDGARLEWLPLPYLKPDEPSR